ncbi:bifunctional chorismate mutase/prephenate dehydrogenase [Rheinheimera sp. UJ63]|uniref:bifunctional chorismate mutase/prephenate dehydrogenase n=1 Tax=Rheinheimera sp. UJ63 TaxID=2910157 RepID=UPI001F201B65|nr:bifunctional chorismate mutase/prephenate dehydrogenase [Rheinheimera sp. UJ63]MCF4009000.1 bifunctional chorismate mutase/prephenate dehydrogenase [Rheinheimera sp. UJ63]
MTAVNHAQQALQPLREQIDTIDAELVRLLAARAKVTAQVGQVKQHFALPVYVPEREHELLTARREQAIAEQVSPELVEDVLRRIMRESYATQDISFVCCRQGGGKVVVVGGAGALGARFVSLFARSGYQVVVLEQQDWPEAASLCADAALVLMAVPITLTAQLIAKLPALPSDCVLADLTSIKDKPLQAMLTQHAGPVVGLHPMFGPDITNLVKQVVVVCHGRAEQQYQWLLQQLTVWGAELAEEQATAHDSAMQLIQAMRHFSSLVYGVHLAEEKADLQQLLAMSSPIYRLELAMIGRLFAQNAELYADIMLSSSDVASLLSRYQQRFGQLLALLQANDKAGLMAEFAKGQQFFGDLAGQFLHESKQLLQKAADGRS